MKISYSKATDMTKVTKCTYPEFLFIKANYSIVDTPLAVYIRGDQVENLEADFTECEED